MDHVTHAEATDDAYNNLYKLGGMAAVLAALLILSEVIVLALYPPPATISGWFTLFQSDPLIGLLDFWGLEVPMYLMLAITFLALYLVLRNVNAGLMALALVFALLGTGIFLATNNPFSMVSLSNQYVAATTEAERSTLLAAGQALLANTNQRAAGGFNVGLFLVSIAGLIASAVMLRSHAFSRSTAYVGLLANTLSLADYLRQVLTASPFVALLVILPGALFLVIWYAMVGWRLYQLGRDARQIHPGQPFADELKWTPR
jgi:hypothetical protein